LRATGAGDAWNAGNILGETYDLSDGARLTLANAVAAYYVSDPSGTHATREKLSKFLLKMSKKDPP
jgi:sugar/nucleoside kinase (ribokinase family)